MLFEEVYEIVRVADSHSVYRTVFGSFKHANN